MRNKELKFWILFKRNACLNLCLSSAPLLTEFPLVRKEKIKKREFKMKLWLDFFADYFCYSYCAPPEWYLSSHSTLSPSSVLTRYVSICVSPIVVWNFCFLSNKPIECIPNYIYINIYTVQYNSQVRLNGEPFLRQQNHIAADIAYPQILW